MITVSSIFRDSAEYIPRYFEQIAALRERVDVRLVIAEGDSTDDTYTLLKDGITDGDTLLKVDHGGPKYPSQDIPARWGQIAIVVRAVIREIIDPGDAFIWVESDLWWDAWALHTLVRDLENVPAVAPLVLAGPTRRFYDVWGFRKDGHKFAFMPPYAQIDGLTKIDSCGSCFATREWGPVTEWDGLWPYKANGQLWLDPTVEIRHPDFR